jgi:DNA repair protein RadC
MKEHFWVVGLNTRNAIQYIDLASLGTLNSSLVHPREVFRFAILKAVSSVIVSHNHPSGDPEPSDDDLTITRRLTEAGRIVGIDLLDHIVIGTRGSFYSFKEKGVI